MCHKEKIASFGSPSSKRRILIILGCLFAFAGAMLGAQPGPLPAFSVQRMDGTAVKSSDWSLQGKWLLIYVERGSDVLLRRLTQQDYPQLAGRIIMVAGGMQPQDAQNLQNRFPDLVGASWYVDTPRNASAALDLHSAPVIIGIQDGMMRWRINGFPADRKFMHSLLTTWAAQ